MCNEPSGSCHFAHEWLAHQPTWKQDAERAECQPLAYRGHNDLHPFHARAKLDLEEAPAAAPVDDRAIPAGRHRATRAGGCGSARISGASSRMPSGEGREPRTGYMAWLAWNNPNYNVHLVGGSLAFNW